MKVEFESILFEATLIFRGDERLRRSFYQFLKRLEEEWWNLDPSDREILSSMGMDGFYTVLKRNEDGFEILVWIDYPSDEGHIQFTAGLSPVYDMDRGRWMHRLHIKVAPNLPMKNLVKSLPLFLKQLGIETTHVEVGPSIKREIELMESITIFLRNTWLATEVERNG